jgi:hypothetical protein
MCKTHSESACQRYSKLDLSVQSHRIILAKTTEKLASFGMIRIYTHLEEQLIVQNFT